MTVIIRGSNFVSDNGHTWGVATEVQPHANTIPGDWMYVIGHAEADFTVTSPGFERVAILGPPTGGYGEAWVGQATDPVSPVTFSIDPNDDPLKVGGGAVIVISSPNKPNTARVATVASTGTSFTLPGVSGRGAGAIALGAATHGIGSSEWDGTASMTPGSTRGAYTVATWGYSSQEIATAEASTWTYTGGTISSEFVVIGIGGFAEPSHCQNFPRDDRLGVGAAQNYPLPKSQQGGHRNFGYW